jgi:uncharacterized protein
MDDRKQITAFLVALAVVESALAAAAVRVDPRSGAGGAVMLATMWAPGLIGLAVQFAGARTLRGMGWKPGRLRYLAIGYFAPLIYGGLPFLISAAVGAGALNPQRWAVGAGHWGLPPTIANGLLLLGTVVLLPALVMGLGEEIGWRGFLVPKLARLFGFWGTVNASAIVWLVFHLPGMILLGYRGAGTPLWWSLLCFAALVYGGTVLFTWLRLRSGSFWPAAIAHATHNTVIQIMFGLAMIYNGVTPWLVGEFGLLTPVALGAAALALVHWGGVPATEAAAQVAPLDKPVRDAVPAGPAAAIS